MNVAFRYLSLGVLALTLLAVNSVDAVAQRKAALKADAQIKLLPMTFFIAKGGPNACGPGCDTWISAEGDFDEGAAARFRVFMGRISYRKLPVVFHSRGGLLVQAL